MLPTPLCITVDGGAGTGKTTAMRMVAEALGYIMLDSGLYYRAAGFFSENFAIYERLDDLLPLLERMRMTFAGERIFLNDVDKTEILVSEECGAWASRISKTPEVRETLRRIFLAHLRKPGLVANGRDMGAVFQDCDPLMIFIETDVEVRAQRRFLEFRNTPKALPYDEILRLLKERDHQDQNRPVAPLRPHERAIVLNTSTDSREQTRDRIVHYFRKKHSIAT